MKPMRRRCAIVLMSIVALFATATAVAAGLSLQEAMARVEHDTHGKVLSAETQHNGKQTVYRIKVLTPDGQVKVVEVPADNN
jgi:uncharacterized membrane protein YkoI